MSHTGSVYSEEVVSDLQKQIKILEDIHEGDMKIVRMLREKWTEEQQKNKNLKEQVRYWKNFALFYWSGHQMGEEANSDSDVWREALEQVEDTSNDCDVEELTKKCMDV